MPSVEEELLLADTQQTCYQWIQSLKDQGGVHNDQSAFRQYETLSNENQTDQRMFLSC